MHRTRLISLLVLAAALCALPAAATTIVRVADTALVDRSDLVVEATFDGSRAVGAGRPSSAWDLRVDAVFKGRIDSSAIEVRVPGGETADGYVLHIYGAPRPTPGERLLLFLRELPDGGYTVTDFPQGAFQAASLAERSWAFRDLSGVRVLDPDLDVDPKPERWRDLSAFRAWIEDRAAGEERPADYFAAPSADEMQSLARAFTLFSELGRNLRWFTFDSGGSVTWRSGAQGVPNLTGGGGTEAQRAVAAWTDEASTPIRLVYGGTSGATAGLNEFDGENVMLWNDPNGEIEGQYNCSGGGTVAIGGPWYNTASTATFDGKTYIRIQGGDVVMNDGIECERTRTSLSKFLEEVTAHEVGHTLGLDHSSERADEPNFALRDALMFFRVHADGRGASLRNDDIAGIRALYLPASRQALVGDLNASSRVDGADLVILARAFGSRSGESRFVAKADLDSNRRIDGADLAILAANFGTSSG